MKNKNVLIVKVDQTYCDYLRNFDAMVPYNFDKKSNRPYVGIIFTINNCDYFAPLSSPKKKHIKMNNFLDFYKLENKFYNEEKNKYDNELIGVINFNNMIPLTSKNYEIIDLDKKGENVSETKYLQLLKLDFICINNEMKNISKMGKKLYDLYKSGRLNSRISSRCCNFPLLEEKCNQYNKEVVNS